MIDQTAETILLAAEKRREERRRFMKFAGGSTLAIAALAPLASCGSDDDDAGNNAPTPTPSPTPTPTGTAVEVSVLNFALNLEYLEAQFYSFAATGAGLEAALLTGTGAQGAVTGGARVPFTDPAVAAYAREIAADERAHVAFLRSVLTTNAVAMPAINISGDANGAFTAAARAAQVIGPNDTFNPYASDENFLLGAFLFEDLGVSAYKGASGLLIGNRTYLEAAAGILAAESYHAGLVRSVLYAKGLNAAALRTNANRISDARDSLDGTTGAGAERDQGITDAAGNANIVPADSNALTFSRSPGQVLNIAYLNRAAVAQGGFFPAGVNGVAELRTSANNA